MKLLQNIPSGKYIVAVSGGVDSIVLLHLLLKQSDLELIVAHVDHGIRSDSQQDLEFVRNEAAKYKLPFESIALHLGPDASEEKARQERYRFLQNCRNKYSAKAIITAHHQNDALETVIINILRGTGWRGIAALRSGATLLRPLLQISKQKVLDYAHEYNLEWREDSTNQDIKYLRNYVRQTIVPRLQKDPIIIEKLLELRKQQVLLKECIDSEVAQLFAVHCLNTGKGYSVSRYLLIMLPPLAAIELLQYIAKRINGNSLLNAQAEGMLLFSKTAKPGKKYSPAKGVECRVTASELIVEPLLIC